MGHTRIEWDEMTAEEQIEHASEEASRWKALKRELQAKLSFRTQAEIDSSISDKTDDAVGAIASIGHSEDAVEIELETE